MTPKEALDAAAEIVGGKAALAREIGVSPQALSQWQQCLPAYVIPVERAVAAALARKPITRQMLRPDLYPEESS